MSEDDRATTKQIIEDQCVKGADFQFIVHFSKVKTKMYDRLVKARESIATKHPKTSELAENATTHATTMLSTITYNASRPNAWTKNPKISYIQHSQQISAQHQSRESKIGDGIKLLEQRLTNMKLQQIIMKDDGNCQFRSIAHQLFGTADGHSHNDISIKNHQLTRQLCVTYLQKHSDQFNFCFDGELEWQRYLNTMSMNGTCGDELTLKAASNVFQCNVHVLTSEQEHYYMCYVPDDDDNTTGDNNNIDPKSKSSTMGRMISSWLIFHQFITTVLSLQYE